MNQCYFSITEMVYISFFVKVLVLLFFVMLLVTVFSFLNMSVNIEKDLEKKKNTFSLRNR